MFERALICTDLFDGLQRLVHCVPNLAISGLKQVIFLHSIPAWEQKTIASLDTEKIKAAREKLAPALENVPEGMSIKIEVYASRPVDAVRRILETNPVDVILMGSPLRTTMQAKLFGSTSLAVAGITDIPILLFRPQLLITYTRDELALRCEHLWKQLLIPYDGSIAALYVIEQIKKRAQTGTFHSFNRCVLLRVVEDSWRDETVVRLRRLEDARQELEAVKTTLESLNLQVDIEVRQGTSLPEILAAASENNISAIAIGDQPKNALEWLARSTTEEILECLWFPLLFFSPKR